MKIQVECEDCGGTGLYSGFAEPTGTAVVCVSCKGSGAVQLTYAPFTGRKIRPGIHCIEPFGSKLFIAKPQNQKTWTYSEFQEKVKAAEVE